MAMSTWAEKTSNPNAAALVKVAKDKCEGCRLSWRLRNGGFKHGEPVPIECTAQMERAQLRALADFARGGR